MWQPSAHANHTQPYLNRCKLFLPSFRDVAADGNSAAHLYMPEAPPPLPPSAPNCWRPLPPPAAPAAAVAAALCALAAPAAAAAAAAAAAEGARGEASQRSDPEGLMGQCQESVSLFQTLALCMFLWGSTVHLYSELEPQDASTIRQAAPRTMKVAHVHGGEETHIWQKLSE
jgi:hypothetical protein